MAALLTPRVVPRVGLSLDHHVLNCDVPETECSHVTYFWDTRDRLLERPLIKQLNLCLQLH
mgnify:CR=1 FL=1